MDTFYVCRKQLLILRGVFNERKLEYHVVRLNSLNILYFSAFIIYCLDVCK